MKRSNIRKAYSSKSTAILVDGSFFLKRYIKCFSDGTNNSPKEVAKNMWEMCLSHVQEGELYRILYYDCPPLDKKTHNPITGELIDFSKTDVFNFRQNFYTELKKLRKMALRLGVLKDRGGWLIRPEITKELLNKNIKIKDLKEENIFYSVNQKGVDIRIGIDIASLAYKKHVGTIILVSGDSDFVPAAKLARREGIDFILDPMWQRINDELFEHIDGLKSTCPKPVFIKSSN
jgi:uncharacterized LabA/DUF88 family protein